MCVDHSDKHAHCRKAIHLLSRLLGYNLPSLAYSPKNCNEYNASHEQPHGRQLHGRHATLSSVFRVCFFAYRYTPKRNLARNGERAGDGKASEIRRYGHVPVDRAGLARASGARRWYEAGQGERTPANERCSSARKLRPDLAAARFFRPVRARNTGPGEKEALSRDSPADWSGLVPGSPLGGVERPYADR